MRDGSYVIKSGLSHHLYLTANARDSKGGIRIEPLSVSGGARWRLSRRGDAYLIIAEPPEIEPLIPSCVLSRELTPGGPKLGLVLVGPTTPISSEQLWILAPPVVGPVPAEVRLVKSAADPATAITAMADKAGAPVGLRPAVEMPSPPTQTWLFMSLPEDAAMPSSSA